MGEQIGRTEHLGLPSDESGRAPDGPSAATIAATADVADSARLGAGTRVWHLAQVGESAVIGHSCVIGRGACVGPGVIVGDRVKIQNYALVYQPATLGDGVFVGPAVVLTNDLNPRAVDALGRLKSTGDWTPAAVHVQEGASLGARSVCVAPVTIGRWAMVGAGAVVVDDVPDFALVVGVPARRSDGWAVPVPGCGCAATRRGSADDGRAVLGDGRRLA